MDRFFAPVNNRTLTASSFFRKWLAKFVAELSVKSGTGQEAAASAERPVIWPSFSLTVAKLLNLLDRPFFILGILFAVWLLIDPILSTYLPFREYRKIAAISVPVAKLTGPAVVGYWTNWLAIKMLFHPRWPNTVWQGLIPARRDDLVESITAGIATRLFSSRIAAEYLKRSGLLNGITHAVASVTADLEFRRELRDLIRSFLEQLVNSPETQQAVRRIVDEAVQNWRAKRLLEKPVELLKGIWGPWIRQKVVEALPELPQSLEGFYGQLGGWLDRLPDIINQNQGSIETAATAVIEQGLELLDVRSIIHNQLAKLDESELEQLLTGNVMAELTIIQTSGGLFGLLVAVAIEYPLARWPIAGLVAGLWLVYRITVRPGQRNTTEN